MAIPLSYLKMWTFDLSFVIFWQVGLCQKRIKEQHEKDKRIYANMFQKFAERDSKVKDFVSLKTATRGWDKHIFRFVKRPTEKSGGKKC